MTDTPAYVNNGRGDVLAVNLLAQALYAPIFDDATRPANHARFASSTLAPVTSGAMERIATDTVAMLRTQARRDLRQSAERRFVF
jgi:MmyB-like transcription regulator ligand binding domain